MATLLASSKTQGRRVVPLVPRRQARGPLVLVADDHEDTRFLLRTLLEMHGLAVMEAGDGLQALEMAERELPDLILMDGSLPRLDGISVTRCIRGLASLCEVPIIFLSGHVGPHYQQAARDAGCDEFMAKPFSMAHLQRVLDHHLLQKQDGKPDGAG